MRGILRTVELGVLFMCLSVAMSAGPDEWPGMTHFSPDQLAFAVAAGDSDASSLAIACRPDVQVSLNQEGWALITPGMLVLDPDYPLDQYVVDIMGPLSDTVFCEQIGQQVMAAVTEIPTGYVCMSELIVEDKLPPQLTCSPDTVPCNTEIADIDFLSFLDGVSDNCDDDVEVFYSYSIQELDCDPSGFAAIIHVTYTATDDYGFSSVCVKDIFMEKFTLDDVVFPPDTSISCLTPDASPDVIGGPTIGGGPIHHFCELIAWNTDVVTEPCSGEQTIMRMWQVMDWCTGESMNKLQKIFIIDTIPPEIDCPDDLTVGTDQWECYATYQFPDLPVTDACSDDQLIEVEFTVNTVPGTFLIGDMVQLPPGDHLVTVTATDDCNSTGTCTYQVTVIDDELPTIGCNNFSTNLNAMGMSVLLATSVQFSVLDNCGIDSVAVRRMTDLCGQPADLDFGPSVKFCCADIDAVVMVEFIAIDLSGNSITCMIEVQVKDVDPPDAQCQDIMAFLDENGVVTIDPLDIDNGSTDNCEIVDYSVDPDSFDCEDLGDQTVVLTVTDAAGNSATCTANVNVKDTIPPVAVCVDITVMLDQLGMVMIHPWMVDGGSSDNCGIDSSYVEPDTFNCSDIGPNNVILVVFDEAGNSDTCMAVVTIVDNPPEATCMDATVYLDDMGMVTITPDDVDGVMDDCSIPDRVVEPSEFDCDDVGPNIVVMTATDDNGNTDTCSATVTVLDTLPPECLTADITVYLDAGGQVVIDSNAVDNGSNDECGIDEITVVPDNFDCSDLGGNQVVQTVTDVNGNTSTCTAIVTVVDTVAPVCSTMDITVYLDANGMASIDTNAVDNGSSDNCGIDAIRVSPDNFNCDSVGTVVVTQTVTDLNGNMSTCTATVTVQDTVSPTCVTTDITVQLDANGMASIMGNAVDDGSDDACGIADISVMPASFDCNDVGIVVVTQTVTDVNGNISTCTATVTVEDNVDPMCSTMDITVQLDASGLVTIDSNAVDDGSMDACGLSSITVDPDMFDCDSVGVVVVTQTVTDVNGNTSTCTAMVTVEDNVGPTCNTMDITVQLDANGMVSINSNAVDNGSSDACGISSITVNPSSFDCSDVGIVEVVQTVTDVNGNTSTCTANVTVEDNVAPTCSTTDITVYLDAGGMASIDSNAVNDGSSDACGISSITVDPSTFDCGSVGVVVVTQTVTDVNGNTSTCSANVTVADTVAPECITMDITVQLGPDGMATIDSNAVDNGSNDACGLSEISLDQTMFDCDDAGMTFEVTQTVTDVNGNTSTCTANVTVDEDQAPTCLTMDITVFVDGSGNVSIADDAVDDGSFDGCSDVTITVNPNMFDCGDLGNVVVTQTVTDDSGNSSTCTATVTVVDTIAPVCMAQDITVALDGSGNATITGADVDNGSNDNCGPVTLDVTPSSFTCDDLGPNEVTLTVTDGSGNTSTCTAIVTVEDGGNLQAICQDITVNLDAGGMVSITAAQIDNGSGGGCFAMDITLMLDDNDFDCSDVGPNTVTLTVTDQMGNTSTCTATVTVVDDIPPVIDCPADMTVDCDDFDPNNLGVFGTATATDNCPGTVISSVASIDTDNCGVGMVTRTFTATDASGNTDVCIQIITIGNPDPFTMDDIICPPAVVNLPECSSTNPQDIPNGEPVILLSGQSCANVSVSFTDTMTTTCDTLPSTPCIVINRTWTIIDSCQLEPGTDNGIFTCTQVINVQDSIGPMFSAVADITVTADTSTCTGAVTLFASATACDMPVAVTNDFNDGGGDASGDYPIGTTTVTFTAEDECCNVSTLQVDVTVLNPDPLLIQCDKIIVYMTEELILPLLAEEFVTPIPGSCADVDDYFFSYSSTDPFDSLQIFDCGFTNTVTPINIYTYDPMLMPFDTCMGFLDFRDTADYCGQGVTISGGILGEQGTYLQEVPVMLSGPEQDGATTSGTGRYKFVDLEVGQSYMVSPFLDENHAAGISTLDLIYMKKHMLGLSQLQSPYQMIAADANRSKSLSASDILEVRKVLLGISDGFSQNTSWRFVDSDFLFPDPFNPFMTEFPEQIVFYELTGHVSDADFVGLKVGDVNGSIFNVEGNVLKVRSDRTLDFIMTDEYVEAGETIELPVRVRNFDNIAGYQFALACDPSRGEIVSVDPAEFVASDMMTVYANDGSVAANWFAPEGIDVPADQELFTLKIRVYRSGLVSQMLGFDRAGLRAEAYEDDEHDLSIIDLQLFMEGSDTSEEFFVMQNRPNPFSDITEIPMYLPEDDMVLVQIYDLNGRLMQSDRIVLSKGYHMYEVRASDLASPGIYYYRIRTSTGQATGKMTVLH